MRSFFLIAVTVFSFTYHSFAAGAETSTSQSGASAQLKAASQKAILVTGASSGIGKQIALTLAEHGYFVYAGARKQKDIEALSALPNMQGIKLDVTVPAEIEAAVQTVRSSGRGLYGLVNNAGVALFEPLIEISEADMQFLMNVNLFGPYRVTRAFAPLIIESQGRITTTGSLSGIISNQFFGPYSMSKHAMEAFTDALAQEMKKFNVAVSIVEPGNFNSQIMANMHRRLQQLQSSGKSSLYQQELERFAGFTQVDRSQHQDPLPVAAAVLDFMGTPTPQRRYMVTPNQSEADFALRAALRKVVELSRGQPYGRKREYLINSLNQLLDEAAQ